MEVASPKRMRFTFNPEAARTELYDDGKTVALWKTQEGRRKHPTTVVTSPESSLTDQRLESFEVLAGRLRNDPELLGQLAKAIEDIKASDNSMELSPTGGERD